jgi:hypothetical protein
MSANSGAELLIVYNVRDAGGGLERARRHRRLWGRRFSEYYFLDNDHVLIVFMPGGERWRAWELVRLSWILDEDLEGRAAS